MECLSHMHLCGGIMLLEVGTCKTLLKHQWKQKSWAAELVTGKPITAVNPVWFSCKEKTKQETSRWSLTLVQISLLGNCNLIWWCCPYQQQTQKKHPAWILRMKGKSFFFKTWDFKPFSSPIWTTSTTTATAIPNKWTLPSSSPVCNLNLKEPEQLQTAHWHTHAPFPPKPLGSVETTDEQ